MPTEKIRPMYDPETSNENSFGAGVTNGQRNNVPIETYPIGYCSGSSTGSGQAKESK